MGRSILVAHDDPAVSRGLSMFLRGRGYECVTAGDAEGAVRALSASPCELVVLGSGVEGDLPGRLAKEFPGVRSLRLERPADGHVPPLDYEEALRQIRLEFPPDAGPPPPSTSPGPLIGRSAALRTVLDAVDRLAASSVPALITGETGTGKEVAARAIHHRSPDSHRHRFVRVHCAAIPAPQLESELFGPSDGRPGLLESAAGGTIFLDEITELDSALQARLLRVIDRQEFTRPDRAQALPLEARLLCATRHDLRQPGARERVREDLFFRLAVVELRMPALRERPEDIADLSAHFIADFERKAGAPPCPGIDPAALDVLRSHEWRGNVRELRNVIERAMILRQDAWIRPGDLPGPLLRRKAERPRTLREALRRHERDVIRTALQECEENRERTAQALGIGVSSLYRKLRRHRLEGPVAPAEPS